MIYGYYFLAAHRRFTADVGTPGQTIGQDEYREPYYIVQNTRSSICYTCSKVSTSILCVTKQIYNEALPVLYENTELAFTIPHYTDEVRNQLEIDHAFRLERHLAKHVRRIVISFPRTEEGCAFTNETASSIASSLQYCCSKIQLYFPKLHELRIYVDTWAWHSHHQWEMSFLIQAVKIMIGELDDVVFYINLYAPRVFETDRQGVVTAHANAINSLCETAETLRKRITIEGWGAR